MRDGYRRGPEQRKDFAGYHDVFQAAPALPVPSINGAVHPYPKGNVSSLPFDEFPSRNARSNPTNCRGGYRTRTKTQAGVSTVPGPANEIAILRGTSAC